MFNGQLFVELPNGGTYKEPLVETKRHVLKAKQNLSTQYYEY